MYRDVELRVRVRRVRRDAEVREEAPDRLLILAALAAIAGDGQGFLRREVEEKGRLGPRTKKYDPRVDVPNCTNFGSTAKIAKRIVAVG